MKKKRLLLAALVLLLGAASAAGSRLPTQQGESAMLTFKGSKGGF